MSHPQPGARPAPAYTVAPLTPEDRVEDRAAYYALLGMAQRRTGAIPAELLARHVLVVCGEGDWQVRSAAMEALLRRVRFAARDELRISARPGKRAVFGAYTTRRQGSTQRPYRTVLWSLQPPAGSCDCPDYIKSSLGLCKHLLAVLQDLFESPDRVARAQAEQEQPTLSFGPSLRWDPVRPLTGDGDWLSRTRLTAGASAPRSKAWQQAARWFAPVAAKERPLADSFAADPKRRLQLARDLLALDAGGERDPGLIEPALARLLRDEAARLEAVVASAELLPRLPKLLRSLEVALYPYQAEGVARLLGSGRLLLADDMGLGKTAQAVAVCHALWRGGRVAKGLLVVPASLKRQWLREWQRFSKAPVAVVDGSPEQRSRAYKACREGFLICSYEQVLRDLPLLRALKTDIVVLDEAQRIKNWATKTALYVKQLEPTYRLVLTGTPMENRLDELASIMDWIDEGALAPKWRLGPAHTVLADDAHTPVGARHLDTLRARLAPHMLRRVRREVLDQLPPRTDTRVPVELSPAQAEEHDALNQPIASLMRRSQKRPLSQAEFLKLMQLLTLQRVTCNGLALARFAEVWPTLEQLPSPTEAMLESLASPKLLELRELLRHLVLEQQRKVVIFSQWRRMLRLIQWATADLLAEAGLRAVYFSGQESQEKRAHNLVEFHDDPRTAVLLCTDNGAVGLNLQRAASCCINVELPWNPAVLEQRIGRVDRLGQEHPVEVYNLISEAGIEARIADVVATKRALFDGLFDGASDAVSFEGAASFMAQLAQVVEPVEVPEREDGEDDEDMMASPAPLPPQEAPAPPAATAALPSGADLSRLLAQVEFTRRDDGRVNIVAPADVVEALAGLLRDLATAMGQAAGGGSCGATPDQNTSFSASM